MLRRALLLTPFLLVGRASAHTTSSMLSDAASSSRTEAAPVEVMAAPDPATGLFTDFAPATQTAPASPPPRSRNRFTLKGGYYGSSEDGIDDGYIINASWMRPVSDVFSSEVEIGYLDASGTDKGVDRDVWAIPLLANARLNLPIGQKLEIYGGLGLGTIYYNADAKTPGVKVSDDGFLFGGDAYFGGTIQLGEAFYLGVESKYYATDNNSDLGGGLDAYVLMLTLGFAR